ncbi:MAG: hypothetical protein WC859_01190 [Elusimicrobiota bacterium]|jgi:hypothetical protein
MNAPLSSGLGLLFLVGINTTLQAAPLQIIRLKPGENFVTTGVLDERSDTAFFATAESDFRYSLETSSATVLQIRVSDFSIRKRIVLEAGETPLQAAVLDPHRRRIYFGTYGDPNREVSGQIIQIGVDPFEKKKTYLLPKGEFGISSGVLSPQGDTAYFGTLFGTVVSIDLTGMTLIGDSKLADETNAFQCAVRDPSGMFAYFGTTAGNVMKIRLADMSPLENITALRQEPGFRCAFFDPASPYVYFGTQGKPAKVIRFLLTDFRPEEAFLLATGQNDLVAGFCPRGKGIAYLIAAGPPAQLIQIKLKPFSILSSRPLPEEIGDVRCAVFDGQRQAVYLGTGRDPGQIVRIPLAGL